MGVRDRRRLWPVDQAWWARLRNLEFIPGASRSSWEPVRERVTEMRCAIWSNLPEHCGRYLGERKTGLGGDLDRAGEEQAGVTPAALTWETVLVKVPFTKEEEKMITVNHRVHVSAKHCSHLIFVTDLLRRFYDSITQITKLRYTKIVRDHTASK